MLERLHFDVVLVISSGLLRCIHDVIIVETLIEQLMKLFFDALLFLNEVDIVLYFDGVDSLVLELNQILLVDDELVVLLGNRLTFLHHLVAAEQ